MPSTNPLVLPPVRGGPPFKDWVEELRAAGPDRHLAATVVAGLEALARERGVRPPPRRVGPVGTNRFGEPRQPPADGPGEA